MEVPALDYVQDMAERYQLGDRIDWDKVPAILQGQGRHRPGDHQGRAAAPALAAPPAKGASPQEVRLSPLQPPKPKVE